MQRKNEKLEKQVNDLIRKLYDDYQNTILPEQRRYSGIPAESLIWNLFRGEYKFSLVMLKEVLKKLKKDI